MKIGYVFTEVPQIAGMFPNAELDEMRARGVEIELFVLRGKPALTDEARRIAARFPVHRSGYLLSGRLLADCAAAGLRHPAAVARLFGRVVHDAAGSPRILVKSLGILPKALHFGSVARRRKITLLHAYWASLPALGAEAMSVASGIPYTTWAHAGGDIYNRNHQTPAALRSRLRSARLVLTCNRANLETFASLAGPEILAKVFLLTHGVDVERFAPRTGSHLSRGSSGSPLAILAVGRLSAAKGFDVLLDACTLLEQHGTPFRCTIAGDGGARQALERRARESGIGGRVDFLGHVDHPALPDLYAAADLFVMPSVIGPKGSRDGLPNVVLEAMASGLAVVGSRVVSIPEAIEHERTGLLVPPGDATALAAAIETLAADPELRRRLGSAAIEKARAEYGRGPAMDRLHRLFVELHEGGDARGGEGLHAREQARERQQAGEREQAREREQEQEREPEQQGGGQAQAGGRGGEARARTAPAGRSS